MPFPLPDVPMTSSRKNVLAALGVAVPALLAGVWLRGCTMPDPAVVTVTEIREVTSAELEKRVQELMLERDGLRATLAGIEARPPRIVYRDTTVYVEVPAPSCAEVVAVDSRGQLSAGVYSRVDGGWQRSMPTSIDVRDCDDGFTFGPNGVVCNRSRLGHLELGIGARAVVPDIGPVAEAGLRWRPSYRSTWSVRAVATTRETFEIGVWKGWQAW